MIGFYNAEVKRYKSTCEGLSKDKYPDPEDFVTKDVTKTAAPISPTVPTLPTNVLVEKKNLHRASTTEIVKRAQQTSWESDIQSQVNALKTDDTATPSGLVLTGKEFSKIKKPPFSPPEKSDTTQ